MKKNHVAKIAALRNALTSHIYRQGPMIEIINDYLGNELDFKITDTINYRGHASKHIVISDGNGDEREIIAEYCCEADEFTFDKIGLGETVYNSISQLAIGIKNFNRIKRKQAWIVPITITVDGCWQFWKILISYNSVIAAWKTTANTIYLQPSAHKYSNTTSRHLSDFEHYVNDELKAREETSILKYASFKY
jgi:hypothetical protein|nr:MAG TPA: hypothetical protein [Caudoviricetes sp.]